MLPYKRCISRDFSFVFSVRVHGADPGGGDGEPGNGGTAGGGAPRPRRQHCGGQLMQRAHDCLHARIHTGNAVIRSRIRNISEIGNGNETKPIFGSVLLHTVYKSMNLDLVEFMWA